MKITSVQPYLVHPGWRKNWLFVKVETDSGLHGWGEAYTQADRDRTTAIHVEELERYLVGRDPFNIKHFTQFAYDDYGQRRGSMEIFSAGQRRRTGDVGHRRQGPRRTGLPATRRGVPGPGARICERLVLGRRDGGRLRTGGRKGRRKGLYGAQIRRTHRAVAVLRGLTGDRRSGQESPQGSKCRGAGRGHAHRDSPASRPDARRPACPADRRVPALLVRGAVPCGKPRRAGGDSTADLNTDRHGRGALRQGGIHSGVREAGRRHHQPRRGEYRRHPGAKGDRGDGRTALRGRLAAQLQLDGHGAWRPQSTLPR